MSMTALSLLWGRIPRSVKVIGGIMLAAALALTLAYCSGRSDGKAKGDVQNARQGEANAKADRKADTKAADERRVDDARATTESAEIKEAVNAEIDPADRRAAYYECVRKLQQARRDQRPADC